MGLISTCLLLHSPASVPGLFWELGPLREQDRQAPSHVANCSSQGVGR